MAEETRELLNINTHHNQQQNPNQSTEYQSTAQRSFTCEDLSVSDHLTDAEAIDFWRRYFGDMSHSRVNLDQFCEAIQAEYATIVFRNLFGDLPNGAINEDQLVSEFYDDLQGRVSIDQDVVYLNALELFSRKKGLKSAIRSLMEDALSRHRAQRSLKLNDTIVSELADVKKMLDAKSEQIAQREKELKKRESLLQKQKLEAARDLESMYNRKLAEAEKKFTRETAAFQKKLNAVERNLINKVKLVSASVKSNHEKSQVNSLQTSSGLKQSVADPQTQIKQLKARISNAEKSYEVLKHKQSETIEQNQKLTDENMKLQEELAKTKAVKVRMNKELQELKSLSTSASTASKQKMVIDDLEKSEIKNDESIKKASQ